MKKYKIKYQEKNEIKEILLETSNLSNEKLPTNIIEIKDFQASELEVFARLTEDSF